MKNRRATDNRWRGVGKGGRKGGSVGKNKEVKMDIRVRYTKKAIAGAFLERLEEKPVNRITVREVCDGAGINCSTFYKYYHDCFDLMEQLENEALLQMDQLLDQAKNGGLTEILTPTMQTLKEHQKLIRLHLRSDEGSRFVRKLVGHSLARLELELSGFARSELSLEERDRVKAFLVGGCIGVIEYWMYGGMRQDSQEVMDSMERLCRLLSKY